LRNSKLKLYELVVRNNLARNEEEARKLILAGKVYVNGERADKAGVQYSSTNSDIVVKNKRAVTQHGVDQSASRSEAKRIRDWVSRGGEKLEHALQKFSVTVKGKRCVDIGVCTGGFSDVLLYYGAREVIAIDTGIGDIDLRIRDNPRLKLHERTSFSDLDFDEEIDLIAIDVSFLSLQSVITKVRTWLVDGGIITALIKPQYELLYILNKNKKFSYDDESNKDDSPKEMTIASFRKDKNIILDEKLHKAILENLLEKLTLKGAKDKKFLFKGIIRSPISGMKGNKEFLIALEITKNPELDCGTENPDTPDTQCEFKKSIAELFS
jgi:23S rRNA (cytidine1920-2'-O)/16S rRNA (cytidine1409-2'-O)-methyltransferase